MVVTGALDPKRFEGEGLNFRAKLIGVEDVPEARGDKMCQNSMIKLKGAVRASGEHKQRIVVNVSLEGLKIIDGVSMAIQYTHAVHRISFIARDVSDSRAFGYIFGTGDGTHKFFAIKTEKQAEQLVLTLRDLFQAVYEMKKQEVEDAKKKQEEGTEEKTEEKPADSSETPKEGQEGQEPVYQVPQNNTPVAGEEKKGGSNLLDLEDQLENIELGMHTFDDMFSNAAPTDGAKTDPWGSDSASPKSGDLPRNASSGSGLDDLAGLDDGFKSSTAFPGMPFGAHSANPFAATSQPTSQPFGTPGFGQPAMSQPFGQPAGQPFGVRPGMAPGAAFGMPGTPVPGATMPVGVGAQMRATFSPPAAGGFGQPVAGGFGQPAGGFGQPAAAGFGQPAAAGFGQPAAGGFGQPAAFPGAPQAQPGFGAFGGTPQGQAQLNLFPQTEPDPNILAPTVLNEPKQEEAPKEQKKDAFAGLVDIGGTDPRKSPKAMFTDLKAPPKKSLNELKVDLIPPASPSPAGSPQPGFMQQASDPFGPLGKDTGHLPGLADTTEDPFDTSYVHIPPPTVQTSSSPTQDSDPFLSPVAQMAKLHCDKTASKDRKDSSKHKHSPKKSSQKLTNGKVVGFSDDFNLHPPEEPPPPLPAEVKHTLAGGPPPPPPRPKSEVKSSTARPRPVPKPRKSASTTSSSPTPSSSSHSDDPFSSTDPFNRNTSPIQTSTSTIPPQKSKDPFLSSQSSFGGKPGDSWDPFSDFNSDIFEKNCFTVFDSSTQENGSVSVSGQDPMYATVNKNPPPPADDSLI